MDLQDNLQGYGKGTLEVSKLQRIEQWTTLKSACLRRAFAQWFLTPYTTAPGLVVTKVMQHAEVQKGMNGGEMHRTQAGAQRKGQTCELTAYQLLSQKGRGEWRPEDTCAAEQGFPLATRVEQIAYVWKVCGTKLNGAKSLDKRSHPLA